MKYIFILGVLLSILGGACVSVPPPGNYYLIPEENITPDYEFWWWNVQFITTTPTFSIPTVEVACIATVIRRVNFRVGPGLDYNIIRVLSVGENGVWSETSDNYARITIAGVVGWSHIDFLVFEPEGCELWKN